MAVLNRLIVTLVLLLGGTAHAADGTWTAGGICPSPTLSATAACWVAHWNAADTELPYWRYTLSSVNEGASNFVIARQHCNVVSGCEAQPPATIAANFTPAPVDPQEELCNALSGTETYASGPGNIAPGASSCNASGCMTTFANTLIRVKNAQGQYVTEGAATFTGAVCTYSETTGSAEDTCRGGSSGQVNGVTVCVPYDPSENTIETVGGSESSTTEGGDTTNSTTTSTTTCSNGSCTTTTNVTTNVNGGTPSTKTTTTTEPQTDYCTKNPKATQCSESGSFTGSCTSSFVCKGDAIECATAKAVNDQLCKFKQVFEMDPAIKSYAEAVMAGTEDPNPRKNPTVVPLGTFNQSNPLSSACPMDVPFSVAGMSLVIPLAENCAWLQLLGNMLVAVSLLGATLFVLRGST